MEHSSLFASAACNTVAQAVVWFSVSGKEYVAYALSNSVAIVDVEQKEVLFTLKVTKGEDRVNSICYCQADSGEVFLFGGGDNGFVHVWKLSHVEALSYELLFALATGTKSIASMSAVSGNSKVLLSAVDANGSVFLFKLLREATLVDTIRFPPAQMPNTVHNTILTQSSVLMVLGCVDGKLHLYVVGDKAVAVGQLSGHEEWITCVSSIRSPSPEGRAIDITERPLLLASGSQDNKIRVWKITSALASVCTSAVVVTEGDCDEEEEEEDELEEEEDAAAQAVALALQEDEEASRQQARLSFSTAGTPSHIHYVYLDALLVGHEDWVTSVHWMPVWPPCLYSASMDRNLVLWREDDVSYSPAIRVGDLGGALGGSIGGNLLGFVSACPGPTAPLRFLAIGYGGACHLWTCTSSSGLAGEKWATERGFWSGHFASVEDASWAPSGDYFLTVSLDQTCRLFAPVRETGKFMEVSRPQIHGYDLRTIALSSDGVTVYTGGEEKLIRAFEMPAVVRSGLHSLCGIEVQANRAAKVRQAYIPELGLSNKGREYMSAQEEKEQESRGVLSLDWSAPPLESQLADCTLWLETAKLFGHNNSVLALTTSPDRQFIASSSKARYGATCVLMLWRLRESSDELADPVYQPAGLLPGHESTVVCLQFSPCSTYLVTAGKDRKICIYRRQLDSYEHVVVVNNAHKRIIWGLSWCPGTGDVQHLITVSRDGGLKLWCLSCSAGDDLSFDMTCLHSWVPAGGTALTAVAVHPALLVKHGKWLLCVGTESGEIQFWGLPVRAASPEDFEQKTWKIGEVAEIHRHSKTVKRVVWRPSGGDSVNATYELASVSEDHSVRLHRIVIQ